MYASIQIQTKQNDTQSQNLTKIITKTKSRDALSAARCYELRFCASLFATVENILEDGISNLMDFRIQFTKLFV